MSSLILTAVFAALAVVPFSLGVIAGLMFFRRLT